MIISTCAVCAYLHGYLTGTDCPGSCLWSHKPCSTSPECKSSLEPCAAHHLSDATASLRLVLWIRYVQQTQRLMLLKSPTKYAPRNEASDCASWQQTHYYSSQADAAQHPCDAGDKRHLTLQTPLLKFASLNAALLTTGI